MHSATTNFGTVIIGGGPAGTAVILAACRAGRLDDLLDRGVAIVEATTVIGAGRLGDYAIGSDSTALTFIDCLQNNACEELSALLEHPLVQEFTALGHRPVPLHVAGALARLIGEALKTRLARHPSCEVFSDHTATSALQGKDGGWRITVTGNRGRQLVLHADNIVLATGAHQPRLRLMREMVGGVPVAARHGKKLHQSGDILKIGGLPALTARLAGLAQPKIAIIGGSTSAVSLAHAVLQIPELKFGAGAVSLLHRRPLRVSYPSAAAALAEDYTEFGPDDLCPLTGAVFRLAGLRLDSRELILRARGIGGRPPEPRLRMHRLQAQDPIAAKIMEEADVIIACFGYRPKGLSLLKENYGRIRLYAEVNDRAPMVDEKCQVLDRERKPVPGVFGIGLAAGFVPQGRLGGEPSFIGQANGLWLWQTAVGGLIVDAVLAGERPARADVTPQYRLAAGLTPSPINTTVEAG